MDLERTVGQLLWVGYDGTQPSTDLLARVRRGLVGGVILFSRNIATHDQVIEVTETLHAAAPPDARLLICVDQEGGTVQRIREPATRWPPMLRLGERAVRSPEDALRAEQLAQGAGRALGLELRALGFDLDFAPVLDIHTNPQNPVIGARAFATTPELVIRLAGAFARGLDEAGVIGCGKHFPGHGDTSVDSHLALPRVDHGWERIRAVELAPFEALRNLPSFMTAHVIFSAVDPAVPATLSRTLLTDVLRGELRYQGLVISDDLDMAAIAANYGIEDAAERALVAGCDVFLACAKEEVQRRAAEGLATAARRSPAVRQRLDDACARVLALKGRPSPPRPPRSVIGAAAHRAIADEISAG